MACRWRDLLGDFTYLCWNLTIIKEYDRLVDGPAARKWLEKERPSLVAARDQAIVELRLEKLQKETTEKRRKVAKVRR